MTASQPPDDPESTRSWASEPPQRSQTEPNKSDDRPDLPPTQSRQFDVSLKQVFERETRAALRLFVPELLHDPIGVSTINTEVSRVQTRQVDLLFRIEAEEPWILHLEAQSTPDPSLPLRLIDYNVAAQLQNEQPVHSGILLLRPEADHPCLTGQHTVYLPASAKRKPTIRIDYEVHRLWTMSVDDFLNGPVGLLPLAPLSDITLDQLASTLDTIQGRLGELNDPVRERELLGLTFLLLGLRREYFSAAYDQILRDRTMINWRDSLTAVHLFEEGHQAGILEGHQAGILEGRQAGILEGRQAGILEGSMAVARNALLNLGTRRFGAAEPATRALIESSDDLSALQSATEAILDINSWDELVAMIRPSPSDDAGGWDLKSTLE